MLGNESEDGADMSDSNDNSGCNDHSSSPRSAVEIQDWMVTYIAQELGVPQEQVDVSVPFENFGLDSAVAIGMTGDLGEWASCRIDPTLVYDYPTIQDMAEYLAGDTPSSPSD
jgi:acyl carrier protein